MASANRRICARQRRRARPAPTCHRTHNAHFPRAVQACALSCSFPVVRLLRPQSPAYSLVTPSVLHGTGAASVAVTAPKHPYQHSAICQYPATVLRTAAPYRQCPTPSPGVVSIIAPTSPRPRAWRHTSNAATLSEKATAGCHHPSADARFRPTYLIRLLAIHSQSNGSA